MYVESQVSLSLKENKVSIVPIYFNVTEQDAHFNNENMVLMSSNT